MNNPWEDNWNPYIEYVPLSKKLNLRGMDIMEKEQEKNNLRIPTLKVGTTGYEIINILSKYEYYSEKYLVDLIEKKQDTIRKTVKQLERNGYLVRKKGLLGENVLCLSRFGKDVLELYQDTKATTPKKITRLANRAVANMMFDESCPYSRNNELVKETFYQTKQEIIEQFPECPKAINASRFTGVYHHYGRLMMVFKLGSSMFWQENAERQVRDYLEQQIFHKPISNAIFLIESYEEEAMKFLIPTENEKTKTGKTLRESLELASCYEKAFMFTTDKTGINQLMLFRSIADIENMFLEAVFEDDQKSDTADSIIDGQIDGCDCIVLFTGDIIQIKKIHRMLDNNLLNEVVIICYDFQEEFLRKAFPWQDRIVFSSYSLSELREVFSP